MTRLYLGLTDHESKKMDDYIKVAKKPFTLRELYQFLQSENAASGDFESVYAMVVGDQVLVERVIGW